MSHQLRDHTEQVVLDGAALPVLTATTVVVGTGSAGYCAAARLHDLGHEDVVVVADKIGAGASRNAGSDKQTYYKLTLSGEDGDSVQEMAQTLFSGGAMDGDNALAEAAGSAQGFLHLVDIGVPFPRNRYGEFIGYKTDHDPRQRATSVGPYTSRTMVTQLERKVHRNGTRVFDECRVVDIVTTTGKDGQPEVAGLLLLRTDVHLDSGESPFLLVRCRNIVYATGGPAGMYATRVFPHGQWGASGAAYRAGVHGKNLTEWQFGLASTKPRWNVSGTYMQVIPRFVSFDADGGDEREFLTEAVGDYGRLMSLVFRKGYQWPFDVRKAYDGSSLIDLLVYRETVLRGRTVYLDFTRNPVQDTFDPSALDPEAYAYLEAAGVLFGTPIERLRAMNEPAYRFYLERNPRVDLATDLLEVDVCVQHNNGGLVVDAWWQSNLRGLFPVGEAAGSHGVYRPGGAALNSGQVGALRAAQYIAAHRNDPPTAPPGVVDPSLGRLRESRELLRGATQRFTRTQQDNTGELLTALQELMSAKAGPVRSAASIDAALAQVHTWLSAYEATVSANPTSRRSVSRTFLVRDSLTAAYVYLSAMKDYLQHGARSRGSVLYSDPQGVLPLDAGALPEEFRFVLDAERHDGEVQESALRPAGGSGEPPTPPWAPVVTRDAHDPAGEPVFRWRPRRPLPEPAGFFENVWRTFREHGNVY